MTNQFNQCKNCQQNFTVYPDDLSFYAQIGVQEPKMCPLCRAQRRLAFRNERNFYKRKCDLCGHDGISVHSPNKKYPVYCHDCWWSDKWDTASYAMDYDLARPFFEQFEELWDKVPKIALMHTRSIRTEYANFAADNKDCYMIIESSNNENCLHCYWIQKTKDCIDCSFTHQCELCYEVDDCYDCYRLMYSKGCYDCRESYFLFDCGNCSNCVGCVNLRSKHYCIFNEQYTKEEYQKKLAAMRLNTHLDVQQLSGKFETFKLTQPHKFAETRLAVNSIGTYLANVKNDWQCFHSYDAEDCRYAVHAWRGAKDVMDCDTVGRKAERIYNALNSGLETADQICTSACWGGTFIEYSFYCPQSSNCFGCAGLKKGQYCILNKQYSPEEYEKIRNSIIKHMKDNETYGEFFPINISPYGYNEACAQEQFPLTKEQALRPVSSGKIIRAGHTAKRTARIFSPANSVKRITELFRGKPNFISDSPYRCRRFVPTAATCAVSPPAVPTGFGAVPASSAIEQLKPTMLPIGRK